MTTKEYKKGGVKWVTLTPNEGMVLLDIRTKMTHSVVDCKKANAKYFTEVAE